MSNRFMDKFSGTHITLMVLGALFVPSALYAVPAYQNVSILNANTGIRAAVDMTGRLFTRDYSAGLPNNPGQQVDIFFNLFADACASTYTVPSGKALVLTAVSGENVKSDQSRPSAQIFVYSGSNCSGNLVSAQGSSDAVSPIATSFGSGILIGAGGSLSAFSSNNAGYAFVHGYLIAASALPATAAEAAPPMAAQDMGSIRAKVMQQQMRR